MSVSSGVEPQSRTAICSDASISRYRLVTGDTTNTTNSSEVVKAATGETTTPIGITLAATTAANQQVPIASGGVSLLEVDGSGTAIDINTSICATTGGKGVSSSTPDAAQQWAIGFALEPSAANGDIIKVQICPHLIVKGTA